jgi:hypothetical protein
MSGQMTRTKVLIHAILPAAKIMKNSAPHALNRSFRNFRNKIEVAAAAAAATKFRRWQRQQWQEWQQN